MADANFFQVSDGQTIAVADEEARASIEGLRESKQDTLSPGDNISIVDDTISATHPGIPLSDDTTSEVTISSSGGSFYTIDSVIRDEFGHIRSINVKTVNIPASGGGSGSGIDSVSYNDNVLTLNLSDGSSLTATLGNAITGLEIHGTNITITYEDGSTGLLSLSADVEVTPDSNNFITSGAVYDALQSTFSSLSGELAGKQDQLNAGSNIRIDGTTISASDTTYTAGSNITISDSNVINAVDTVYSAGDNIGIIDYKINAVNTTYSAGNNIQIDENNVINATNTTYSFDLTPTENSTNPVTSGGVYTAIQSAASSVYEYKGACNRIDLPLVGTGVGDVWNLLDASEFGPAGTNVAWNGTEWQVLGGSYSAGDNITISNSGVISAVNTTYSAGTNISISPDNTISAQQKTYTAGSNITIDNNDVISATDTTYQAGANVSIEGTTISASDTTYTEGENIYFTDENAINARHPAVDSEEDSGEVTTVDFGDSFQVINLVHRDVFGHVLSINTNTITLPQSELIPGANIEIDEGVISSKNTTYSAGTLIEIDANNVINASHPDVQVDADTTSSISPSAGSNITMVDSVERDELGHVLYINTKTVKLPPTAEVEIDVDTVIDENSQNPVTNSAIAQALDRKISEPDVEGSAGQVLTTDGYGGRSWVTPGSGGGVDFNTTYTLTNENGVITLTDSNRRTNTIPMDTAPVQDSTEPITSGAVYDALQGLTTYTAGANIHISDSGVISAVNTTYSAGSNITITNGVISATGTSYIFDNQPTDGSSNPVTSDGIYHAIENAAGTVYTAGSNISISDENVIASYHPSIDTSADTTSSITPAGGDTFTVIDSVTRDTNGHVTTLNTKTVTLPTSQGGGETYTLSNVSGVLTLTDSHSQTSEVEMDTEPTVNSTAPVTSGGVYSWIINKLSNLFGQVARDTLERFEFIAGTTYGELRLKDNEPSQSFPTKLDFRLMGIPSTITSMYQFLYPNCTRDRQDHAADYANITKIIMGIDTSSITNMSSAFNGLTNLTSIDLTGFDTSNVTTMLSMFRYCSSLVSLDLSSFNFGHASIIRYMLNGCTSLQELDISGCDMSNITDADQAFSGLSSLISVITDANTQLPSWTSLDMSDSVNLSLQSAINVLDALPTVDSSVYTYECTFASNVYTTVSSDTDGAAAISGAGTRGWTIASV